MDMNTVMELAQNEKMTSEVYEKIAFYNSAKNALLHQVAVLRRKKIELEESGASAFEDIHLTYAIRYCLENDSPASKAFVACEKHFNKEDGWCEKVIEYDVNKNRFKRAVKTLLDEKNEQIFLLQKYAKLKSLKIKKNMRYRALLVELSKQYKSAEFINKKNRDILEKELIIEEMSNHITYLNQELEASLSMDLETRAKLLRRINPKYTYGEIGEIIGVSRQRASNLINGNPKVNM